MSMLAVGVCAFLPFEVCVQEECQGTLFIRALFPRLPSLSSFVAARSHEGMSMQAKARNSGPISKGFPCLCQEGFWREV